jgi:hypothetical protein
MADLATVAPAFVEMAHRIVWATAATVGPDSRPRGRILHPFWQWDEAAGGLWGWVATGPTPVKRAHLAHSPYVSVTYWSPNHDTCTAECRTTWAFDDETRTTVWNLFAEGPAPVGYNPAMIPGWDAPTSPSFAALRLDPWRLRVFPGTALLGQGGDILTWP